MEWISVKDRLPSEYRRYLVYTNAGCQDCYDKKEHLHNMMYRGQEYDVCLWSRKDMNLVNWYQEKGDHSWDWCAKDHWSEGSGAIVTHWMELPESPLKKQ